MTAIRRATVTEREMALLRELATSGDTVPVCAARLGMAPQTAKNHLGAAYAGLGVRGLREAFIALGWLVPQEDDR